MGILPIKEVQERMQMYGNREQTLWQMVRCEAGGGLVGTAISGC